MLMLPAWAIYDVPPSLAGWTDYPYAAVIALFTVIVVLLLEHLVSLFYERRLRRNPPRPPAPNGNAARIGARTPPRLPQRTGPPLSAGPLSTSCCPVLAGCRPRLNSVEV